MTIELIDNSKIDKLKFIDTSGKTIIPNKVEKNKNIIYVNIANLIEGTYLLELISDKEINKIRILVSR